MASMKIPQRAGLIVSDCHGLSTTGMPQMATNKDASKLWLRNKNKIGVCLFWYIKVLWKWRNHHSHAWISSAMDIWVWTVVAVLLTAFSHVWGAENIAERSFITSSAQDGNLYSVRYDLIDEYGSNGLNKPSESSPFHEVYSVKGKDGEIQRIHYATDNKGLRANFHSTSLNVPPNFNPASQPSPFMWPLVANPEKAPFVHTDVPMPFPPLGFAPNSPSQNQVRDKFQIPSGLSNSMGINVNNVDKLDSSKLIQFDVKSLMNPISQAPALQDNFGVYPVFQKEPAMSFNKKITNVVSSQVGVEFPYQAEISQSANGFRQQIDNAAEALYETTAGDLLRIPKPIHFQSSRTETENSPPEAAIRVRENSFSFTTPQVLPSSPTQSGVPNTVEKPENLPRSKQPDTDSKKYSQPKPSKETKPAFSSPKSKLLTLNEKNQRKMTKVLPNKQKTQMAVKKLKPTLDLEKTDLSVLSSPVSTVFDISTDNGRYYHYVLNMVKPEIKNPMIMKSKYFSSGNALLKLLNETGVSYKSDDFVYSEPNNGQSQKIQPPLDIIFVEENRDRSVNVSGHQNEIISAAKISDLKPIEESAKETYILDKVEENLQTTLAQEEITTDPSTSIPSSTTTEIPTSSDLEVSTLSLISEFDENNETNTTVIAVHPTKISVKENLTEEVEAGSLYITIPKLLAPLNWLFNTSSRANNSELETSISSSSISDNTTTTFKELAESMTLGLEKDSGDVITETVTTMGVPTTNPYTTTVFDITTENEKAITPLNTAAVTSVETTTSSSTVVLDMTSTVAAELLNNESKYSVTENPNIVSEIENNTETSSKMTIVSSVSTDGTSSKATNPEIQVNDLNEIMSRLHKLSEKLATNVSKKHSIRVTAKPKYGTMKKRKAKIEHLDETDKLNLSPNDNSPAINTLPLLSDLNLFSSLESEESFSKQLPKFKTLETVAEHQVEKVESPIVEYSLIHPSLLRNGETSFLRFSPYILSKVDQYSPTSSPGLIDFILRNSNFESKQSRQSQEIPNQIDSKINSLGGISENVYQKSDTLTSDYNDEKNLIPGETSSLGNEMKNTPSQINPQNIEMVQSSLFPTTYGNSFIVDYDSVLPVGQEDRRLPEISQTVENAIIQDNNLGRNNNILDLTYGNAYIDIYRLNGSEADVSRVTELKVLDYVPVESLTDNLEASSVVADTSALYLQDPVLIFEDYPEESNQRLQIPENNVIGDGTFSSYNADELPILIIDDSLPVFGARLQEPLNSGNTENAQANNQFHNFQNNAGLSTSQWMK